MCIHALCQSYFDGVIFLKKKLENVSREKVERLEIERKRGDNEIGRNAIYPQRPYTFFFMFRKCMSG